MLELETERNNTKEKTKLQQLELLCIMFLIIWFCRPYATPAEMPTQDLKINAAWKIWQLLMRRLSTVQEPGQKY